MRSTWWRAGLISLTLLGATTAVRSEAQVLRKEWGKANEVVRIELPAVNRPSLLVIDARNDGPGSRRGDGSITLDGVLHGPISRYSIGKSVFRAHVAIHVTPATRGRRPILEVTATRGMQIGPVRLMPAGVLDLEVVGAQGEPVSALVDIVSASGHPAPLFAVAKPESYAGPGWLVDHRKRVLVPAGVKLKLLAWTHPFRAPARHAVTARVGGATGVRFVLGPDLRPKGSVVMGLAVGNPLELKNEDRAFGVGERVVDRARCVDSDSVRDLPDLFVKRMLRKDALPPVVVNWGVHARHPFPAGPRAVRTLKLAGGRLLHSNGPVIEPAIVFRDRTTGRVGGNLRLTLPADVVPEKLVARSEKKKVFEIPIDRSGPVPLDLDLPRLTRLAVVFHGKSFKGDPLAGPKPFAATILVVP